MKKDPLSPLHQMFAENIKHMRKIRGLNQKELGKILGINYRLLSRYETGQTVPSVFAASNIAMALQVRVDDLLHSFCEKLFPY